jgi:VanZ family protein
VQRLRIIAAIVYTLLIIVGSLLPPAPEGQDGWDTGLTPEMWNWLHVPAYLILFVLVASATRLDCRPKLSGLLLSAACVALGALLEASQAAVPGRMGSLSDLLLNALGVGLGTLLVLGRGQCAVCSFVTRGLGCPPQDADKNSKDQ